MIRCSLSICIASKSFAAVPAIELTNDVLSKKAFTDGIYKGVNSRVQPGSGEPLVSAAIELLKELE